MLIVDGHLDLSWNALHWNRDLCLSAHTIRTPEGSTAGPGRTQGTVALPEMRQGRIALCFANVVGRSSGGPHRSHLPVGRQQPGTMGYSQ